MMMSRDDDWHPHVNFHVGFSQAPSLPLLVSPSCCSTDSSPSFLFHIYMQSPPAVQNPITTPSNVSDPRSPRQESVRKTRNMDYVMRSGLAGGIAGCMVLKTLTLHGRFTTDSHYNRPKLSLHLLIESRFSFRHAIPSLSSMQVWCRLFDVFFPMI